MIRERLSPFFDRRSVAATILSLLLLVLVKGAFFSAMLPAWLGDDEPAYWADIREIAGERTPTFRGYSPTTHGRVYPTLVAPVYLAAQPLAIEHRLFAIRLLGALAYAGIVWLTFLAARDLWPASRFIQLTAPAIVAFNPKFSMVMASSGSDVFLMLVFTAFLYTLTSFMLNPDRRRALMVIVILAIGVFTKKRFLIAFPLTLASLSAFTPQAWRAVSGWKPQQRRLAASIVAGTAVGLALLTPVLARLVSAGGGNIGLATVSYDPRIAAVWSDPGFRARMFGQFWGFFAGPRGIYLSTDINRAIFAVMVLAGAGLVARAYRALRESKILTITSVETVGDPGPSGNVQLSVRFNPLNPEEVRAQAVIAVYALAIFFTILATGAYEISGSRALGRYLLIASLPVTLFLAAGLDSLIPAQAKRAALAVLISAMFVLNIVAITAFLMPVTY